MSSVRIRRLYCCKPAPEVVLEPCLCLCAPSGRSDAPAGKSSGLGQPFLSILKGFGDYGHHDVPCDVRVCESVSRMAHGGRVTPTSK